ncbi:hypothetical protein ScPMuIL_007180 [Solemya velum]
MNSTGDLHMSTIPGYDVIKRGIDFVPLDEVIESASKKTRANWDRLWSNMGKNNIQPLLYAHPVTGLPTLCIHSDYQPGTIYDYGTENEQTNLMGSAQLKKEITSEIEKDDRRLIYSHKWLAGDFIITDNLALAHRPSKETQIEPAQIGLRVLHRVTVEGTSVPSKTRTDCEHHHHGAADDVHVPFSHLCCTVRHFSLDTTTDKCTDAQWTSRSQTDKTGVEVRGINLSEPVSDEVIEEIRKTIHKHRLLLFRNQTELTDSQHVEVAKWFGKIVEPIVHHPKAPNRLIVRVSNDRREGHRGLGTKGWHVDFSKQEKPNSFSLYHIVTAAQKGNTDFVPLNEVIESASEETRANWDRLWIRIGGNNIQPLLYPHPVTGLPTLCIHFDQQPETIYDYGTENEQTNLMGSAQLKKEIASEIEKDDRRLIYSHKWLAGDLIITDNLALAHRPSKETQIEPAQIGLRVLHRVTVEGTSVPSKTRTVINPL